LGIGAIKKKPKQEASNYIFWNCDLRINSLTIKSRYCSISEWLIKFLKRISKFKKELTVLFKKKYNYETEI